MKKIKIKKKHGYIGAILGSLAVLAHITHYPLLLLAFLGIGGTAILESPVLKIVSVVFTIAVLAYFVYTFKNKYKYDKEYK